VKFFTGGAPSKQPLALSLLCTPYPLSERVPAPRPQHPTRGLFLRNYLSVMTKDKLPDTGPEHDEENGNVEDAINFTLQVGGN